MSHQKQALNAYFLKKFAFRPVFALLAATRHFFGGRHVKMWDDIGFPNSSFPRGAHRFQFAVKQAAAVSDDG